MSSPHMFGSALVTLTLGATLGIATWVWQDLRLKRWEDIQLEGLQIFGALPAFSLTERSGRRVTLEDLRGKVWIANLIYTRCPDTCQAQITRMARLQEHLADEPDVRLVSITLDPDRDTPPILSGYAARLGAHPDRWLFLTGEKQAVYSLIRQGFHLAVEDSEPSPAVQPGGERQPHRPGGGRRRVPDGAEWRQDPAPVPSGRSLPALVGPSTALAQSDFLTPPILHSPWLVAVDRQGRIRVYYKGDDAETLRRLRRDVKTLLRHERT